MPFFYDLQNAFTTSGTPLTEVTQMWAKTVANQETVSLFGVYFTARGAVAGGASGRVKHNTGTTASGGTSQTPAPKNLRGNPAAQSVWANGATGITPGGTLVTRLGIGYAQTGGMGGYQPPMQNAAIQMMPNTTNPVDLEFTQLAASASVPADLTIDIGEGI